MVAALAVDAPRAGATLASSLLARPPGSEEVTAPFVTELKRSISRGTDFRATATTPGFTYEYDPTLNVYQRTSSSLGPAFLERPDTLGKGRYDVGISALIANYDTLDGDDLDGLDRAALFQDPRIIDSAFSVDIHYDDFDLTANAMYPTATYGVTDRLDVNVLIPLFYTALETVQTQRAVLTGTTILGTDDDVLGVGDLQLRGKYGFKERGAFRGAAGFSLRLPTGNEDDFQGIGDVTLTPSVVLARNFGPHDVHVSLGIEVDASDVDRSRGTYGIGGSLGLGKYFTAYADLIGTSMFTEETDSELVQGGVDQADQEVFEGEDVKFAGDGMGNTRVITTFSRQDVVDFSVGLKVNPFGTMVVFGGVILPVTDDGVRADVIPTIGAEVSF